MGLQQLNVGIVGGSISGCAAAIALTRAGHKVSVFERSSTGLQDRGSGIAIPYALRDKLIENDYLDQDYASCDAQKRLLFHPDGSKRGKLLWEQATPACTNNWGILWAQLRKRVNDETYFEGEVLSAYAETEQGVEAVFQSGAVKSFDLLIGADGYGSVMRTKLHPGSDPTFAGYVLWRGNYLETEIQNLDLMEYLDVQKAWITVGFEGGHGVLYAIPDQDRTNHLGQRRVNWAVYKTPSKGITISGTGSIPPGEIPQADFDQFQDEIKADFPPEMAALVLHSAHQDVSIQPIFDSVVDTYIGKRTLLIGDAGSITRPHTASGATKALEDVLAIEQLLESSSDLGEFLSAYDEARCETAKTLSRIGKNIGDAQVTHTPDWANMSGPDFDAWIKATMAGEKFYLYAKT